MKKKTIWALATALLALLATGCAAQTNGQTTIVTSFYPMYVLTLNVTDGIDGVTVQNMAEQNVGCLHDYQLQTRDMVTLEGADALVINGGGMEQFMDKVLTLRADLPVIDASEGIAMFPSDETHDHDAHAHDEHDELYNAHVWLDPSRAIKQVQNIADGLGEADPAHAAAYQENAAGYIERLTALDDELKAQRASSNKEQLLQQQVDEAKAERERLLQQVNQYSSMYSTASAQRGAKIAELEQLRQLSALKEQEYARLNACLRSNTVDASVQQLNDSIRLKDQRIAQLEAVGVVRGADA